MKLVRSFVAAAALLGSFSAQAALVYSASAAGGYLGPLAFTTSNAQVTTETDSSSGVRLAPLTVIEPNPYSLITTGGVAQIVFAGPGVSSFSFLWGSPDDYNFLDIVTNNLPATIYDGDMLGALAGFGLADGDNVDTRLFTISGTDGTLIQSLQFRSTGIAFEVAAAAPVPLPAAAWLLLSGLAGLGFVGRRRKTA